MRLAFLVCSFLLARTAFAAEGEMVLAKKHVITSKALGEARDVWVHLPAGYETGSARYHVVYVLDGQALILPLAGHASVLARSADGPPLVIVGVTSKSTEDRRKNLVPGAGADPFLTFLVDEVRPFVDRTYRTKPFQILIGHSLAGLFALHAFSVRPSAFAAYVSLSPVLSRDDHAILRAVEAQVARSPRAIVYAAMGDEGSNFPRADFDRLTAIFAKGRPPLTTRAQHLPGEGHMSTPSPGMWNALRFVYEGWAPAGTSVAALEAHGKRLSERFGEPVAVPEDVWNRAGYDRLQAKDLPGALALFERMTRAYPKSANAWDSLAEGYEAAGRMGDAKRAVDRAVGLLGPSDPNRALILEHQEKLRRASR